MSIAPGTSLYQRGACSTRRGVGEPAGSTARNAAITESGTSPHHGG